MELQDHLFKWVEDCVYEEVVDAIPRISIIDSEVNNAKSEVARDCWIKGFDPRIERRWNVEQKRIEEMEIDDQSVLGVPLYNFHCNCDHNVLQDQKWGNWREVTSVCVWLDGLCLLVMCVWLLVFVFG